MNYENVLQGLDRSRVDDFLGKVEDMIRENRTPPPMELVNRRLALSHVKAELRAAIAGGHGSMSSEADLREQSDRVKLLLLENWTRQVDPTASGVTVIPPLFVKSEHFVTPGGRQERRTYMGLHTGNLDTDGLSVVSAAKPVLHEQPYHTHSITGEETFIVHPTDGLFFEKRGARAKTLNGQPLDLLHFSPDTPHTLKNPTRLPSVDVSVKMPQALSDRTGLDHNSITEHLEGIGEVEGARGFLRKPIERTPTFARYLIQEMGRTYVVEGRILGGNERAEMTHRDEVIKAGTVELFTAFPQQDDFMSTLQVDDGEKSVDLRFGNWGVMPTSTSHYSVKNSGEKPLVVYRAFEVNV